MQPYPVQLFELPNRDHCVILIVLGDRDGNLSQASMNLIAGSSERLPSVTHSKPRFQIQLSP